MRAFTRHAGSSGHAGATTRGGDFAVVEELHRSFPAAPSSSEGTGPLASRSSSRSGGCRSLGTAMSWRMRWPCTSARARHTNLIAFLGSYRRGSRSRAGDSLLVMVFEYASQGDLHHALLKQGRRAAT